MMIYMTHPLHGATHAFSETEAQANEKNGWVRAAMPTAAEINALKRVSIAAPEPEKTAPPLEAAKSVPEGGTKTLTLGKYRRGT